MKKFYFIILLLNIQLFAQPLWYNFGTGIGTWATGASTTFLPTPTSGTARVYIGGAGGQFDLVNPGIAGFGTDTELQGTASTLSSNGNINKFSIYNITSPSPLFSLRFSFRLDFGTAGSTWLLMIGDGAFYSNNNTATNDQWFCGMKWTNNASDPTIIDSYVGLYSPWGLEVGWGINVGENHVIEVFINNTSATNADYNYGTSQNVAPYSYDLWLDGTLERDDENRGARFAHDQDITSFAFWGRNSSSNSGLIYIDDIYYSNILENGPLPVELTSFTSQIIGNTIKLKWETATEVTNYGFDIERKVGNTQSTVGQFEKIGFVNGNGNSNSPKYYSFEDKDLSSSIYSYRLKQIDTDGKYEYSKVIQVDLGNPKEYTLLQNFPNPFNPSTKIEFRLPEKQMVNLRVYNVLGEMVKSLINEEKEAGTYSVTFDGTGLPSGIYIYRLETANYVANRKMSLIK